MLKEVRRSDNRRFLRTGWGKTLSRYLLRASDFFKKHHRCLRDLHVQILKRMGKVPPWFMSPESETSNFELLVPSKVQLQESETVFLPRRISSYATHRLSRIGKQYANMLEEYDKWSLVFNHFFE